MEEEVKVAIITTLIMVTGWGLCALVHEQNKVEAATFFAHCANCAR